MIFYLDNNNKWKVSNNSTVSRVEDFFQRIQTFKYEQPFNQNNGIDYIAVFNNQADIESQLDEIIQEFKPYFQDITYNEPEQTGERLNIKMNIILKSGETISRELLILGA